MMLQPNQKFLVSHQLGHASTQVTDLYTHIVNDEQRMPWIVCDDT